MLKLNLGCGLQCPDGWVNIDSSFGVWLSRYPLLKRIIYAIIPVSWGILPNIKWTANTAWMDLTKRFKYADSTVDYIYSSHTFEHLTYNEAAFVLAECFRVMKPGAVIRVIVPDLEAVISIYFSTKEKNPEFAAVNFHNATLYFETPAPKAGLFALWKYNIQKKNNHQFLYDKPALKKQLESAGFQSMIFKNYSDSLIPGIDKVDIPERFESAICIEAKKG